MSLAAVSAAADTASGRRGARRAGFARPAESPFPDSNPFTPAKADLGRYLFFDPLLSGTGTLSCATCHDPRLSWGDGRPRAQGMKLLKYRSPTLIDVAYLDRLGWDGKFATLESVAFVPITAPGNMDLPEAELIRRLSAIPAYVERFAAAFPGGAINRVTVEQALATYERTLVAEDSPFDRWLAGDEAAIDISAKRGFDLFTGKARCANCHSGWAFTDGSFHDIGVAKDTEPGRGAYFPTSAKLQHAFKTPTLRDVVRRAPYMHDGSVATLADVVDLYDRGGVERPSRAEDVRPLGLTAAEKQDLLAFLATLTSPPKPFEAPVPPR